MGQQRNRTIFRLKRRSYTRSGTKIATKLAQVAASATSKVVQYILM